MLQVAKYIQIARTGQAGECRYVIITESRIHTNAKVTLNEQDNCYNDTLFVNAVS